MAALRARHPVLRASIRASAGTTPNPKSVMCAGTATPGEIDGGGAEAPCESPTKHGPRTQRVAAFEGGVQAEDRIGHDGVLS